MPNETPCEEVPIKCVLFPVLRKQVGRALKFLIPGMEAKGNWVIGPRKAITSCCLFIACGSHVFAFNLFIALVSC